VSDPRSRAFGTVAAAYDRGRPGWPEELLDRVPVPAGAEVLDLAAGTGKLSRLLATRHRVVAVEPDDSMRALIRGVEVLPGTAESIPLAASSVDAVFSGDAFHWFDGPPALAEIVRVLRPGGVLAIAMNEWKAIEPRLPDDARALVRETVDRAGPAGSPLALSGAWKEAFAASPFGELHEEELAHAWPLDKDGVVALFSSMSNVARLPQAERIAFAGRLAALVPDEPRRLELACHLTWTALG
jgi:SAM-dependent methyltransferase